MVVAMFVVLLPSCLVVLMYSFFKFATVIYMANKVEYFIILLHSKSMLLVSQSSFDAMLEMSTIHQPRSFKSIASLVRIQSSLATMRAFGHQLFKKGRQSKGLHPLA